MRCNGSLCVGRVTGSIPGVTVSLVATLLGGNLLPRFICSLWAGLWFQWSHRQHGMGGPGIQLLCIYFGLLLGRN